MTGTFLKKLKKFNNSESMFPKISTQQLENNLNWNINKVFYQNDFKQYSLHFLVIN